MAKMNNAILPAPLQKASIYRYVILLCEETASECSPLADCVPGKV